MHVADLLDEALRLARKLGYEIRQDWLGGEGSGHCLVRGRKLVLLDLAQPQRDQLVYLLDALRGERRLAELTLSDELSELLDARRVA